MKTDNNNLDSNTTSSNLIKMDVTNEIQLKKLQKYTIWYSYFSFWMFAWFVLYIIGIISIEPPLLFYYFTFIFAITTGINNITKDKFSNKIILSIQFISFVILDIVPIYFLSSKNLIYNRGNIILIIYSIIYLISLNLRFKNENLLNLIYNIYYNYNNISKYDNITIKKYLLLKYNIKI